MLISVEVASYVLLVGKLGMLCRLAHRLIFLNLLSSFYGMKADSLQMDRVLLQSRKVDASFFITLFHLVDQLAYRDTFDAALTIDHVRPWLFRLAARTDSAISQQLGARWAG